jgi:hypothetical protein
VSSVNALKAIAVWEKEDGDGDQSFASEMALIVDGKEVVSANNEISFPADKYLARIVLTFPIAIKVERDCIVQVVSRVRRTADSEWIEQKYPIRYKVIPAAPSDDDAGD